MGTNYYASMPGLSMECECCGQATYDDKIHIGLRSGHDFTVRVYKSSRRLPRTKEDWVMMLLDTDDKSYEFTLEHPWQLTHWAPLPKEPDG